ncbi:probable 28S ribosomal protein S6, mitochondrial [Cataglyphis hispanica]|uniref:probable 28S ribosomal protein S6, mitochondrial n=1 Tax=Cataglyphis hispanica TaxID=1086592 RepID=UPI00217FCF9E|nr:probable 28S ribosomal protein S6, mitochondrial [Cataglyphis hispanica]
MPTYEMPLMIRVMKKPELIATLKRATTTIFNTGGFLRKIENWGVKPFPCKVRAHGHIYKEANHFLIHFDIPPKEMEKILDQYNRDVDIVKLKIFKKNEPIKKDCTFHEEMLPPPYRPSVQKLVELAKKRHDNKYAFKYNSGLNYYPFNK